MTVTGTLGVTLIMALVCHRTNSLPCPWQRETCSDMLPKCTCTIPYFAAPSPRGSFIFDCTDEEIIEEAANLFKPGVVYGLILGPTFTAVPVQLLRVLTDLKEITINNNHVQALKSNAFAHNPGLIRIQLARNDINRIEDGTFTMLKELALVDLSANKLTQGWSEDWVSMAQRQVIIHVNNNPTLSCDCDVYRGRRTLHGRCLHNGDLISISDLTNPLDCSEEKHQLLDSDITTKDEDICGRMDKCQCQLNARDSQGKTVDYHCDRLLTNSDLRHINTQAANVLYLSGHYQELPSHIYDQFVNLIGLFMYDMYNIGNLPKNSFLKNRKLKRVDIIGCNIQHIDPDAFAGLEDLREVYFDSSSPITPLSEQWLSIPWTLTVSGDQMACDCVVYKASLKGTVTGQCLQSCPSGDKKTIDIDNMRQPDNCILDSSNYDSLNVCTNEDDQDNQPEDPCETTLLGRQSDNSHAPPSAIQWTLPMICPILVTIVTC